MVNPVFGSHTYGLMLAALFGAIGGLALGLMQEKGLEAPHFNKATGITFFDLGFLADVLVGALAAMLTYAANPPSEGLRLFSATLTAGIGGSGILKGYIKGTAAREQAKQAALYRAVAEDASKGTAVSDRLAQLHVADEQLRRKYGPR